MSPTEIEIEMTAKVIPSQQDEIHEYAFGIMSCDTKGLTTVLSISKLSTSPQPGTEEDLLNSAGFQSWSMSCYQSLYMSSGLHEEDEQEDSNNNKTTTSPPVDGEEGRRPSLKTSRSTGSLGLGGSGNNPKKKPSIRRWSTNSFFGNSKSASQPARVYPMDPDMSLETTDESDESWISSIVHIPDRIRQHIADKHRFNVRTVPREELQNLYCY
ncbi:unnamed protein product [Orchesella dallaii]|uniref:Uncharacterized protein n=1 Tax=Orchesella dallaii TaxID=48710 RepID=A0ABP1QQI7_9HEXA